MSKCPDCGVHTMDHSKAACAIAQLDRYEARCAELEWANKGLKEKNAELEESLGSRGRRIDELERLNARLMEKYTIEEIKEFIREEMR